MAPTLIVLREQADAPVDPRDVRFRGCAIETDLFEGGFLSIEELRGTRRNFLDALSVTSLADGMRLSIDGSWRRARRHGARVDRHRCRAADRLGRDARVRLPELSQRVRRPLDSLSPVIGVVLLPDGSTPSVRVVHVSSADVTATFTVTAPWSGERPLSVEVELSHHDGYFDWANPDTAPDYPLTDLGSPLTIVSTSGFDETFTVESLPREGTPPVQWEEGEISIVAEDGSRVTLRPAANDPARVEIRLNGADEPVLPATLDIDVTLADEVRERGLFRSRVYTAGIELEARFDPVRVAPLSDTLESVQWDKAWVAVGLSDTRAIAEVGAFAWDGEARALSPGSRVAALPSGFHAPLPGLEEGRPQTLAARLVVKGSGDFRFAPFGESTTATVRSDWPHPSFGGDALPGSHEISDAGFVAEWAIPHLARNYPQRWSGEPKVNLYELTAGVSLYETVSLYSQATRAVKYGLLFVGLTYLTLLAFEIALARPLHPVQYALVGVALCVFFLVLLALAEHLGFARACACAATLTVAMIALYTGAVLRSAGRALAVLALLAALYAILYSLLRLEDYALLLGTALLVAVIAVLMVVTRNLHRRGVGAVAGVRRR